jgi:hypothetical protein
MTDQERLAKELFADMKAEYDALMAAKAAKAKLKAEVKLKSEVIKLVPKPDAPLHKAIKENSKTESWLEGEIRRLEQAQREFEEEQDRLARDPARSNHHNTAYRRSLREASPGHARYYAAGEALTATREARLAQRRYASFTVNRNDSDADLHISPEDQIWR